MFQDLPQPDSTPHINQFQIMIFYQPLSYIDIYEYFLDWWTLHTTFKQKNKWSLRSLVIEQLRIFVLNFLQEKTWIKIDFHNSQGGRLTTGNVAKRYFQNVSNQTTISGWYWHWPCWKWLHRLVILRIVNSDKW